MFGKKGKKADKTATKAAPKAEKSAPKQPKVSKPSKPSTPPDIYTILLGLSALFFIVATIVLGLNYGWYQTTDPPVVPMNWAR